MHEACVQIPPPSPSSTGGDGPAAPTNQPPGTPSSPDTLSDRRNAPDKTGGSSPIVGVAAGSGAAIALVAAAAAGRIAILRRREATASGTLTTPMEVMGNV